jgi:hypothetical protein
MRKLFIITLICLFAGEVMGQYFIPATESFSKKKESKVITKDKAEHVLFFHKAKYKKGVFKEVYFNDADGNEKVFLADEIQSMELPPSNLGKLMSLGEATESVATMKQHNFDDAIKKDMAYFKSSILPVKKPIPVLFQVVNPGFDSKITVFHDPWASETGGVSVGGVQMTGGLEKSYYVMKDGETIKVTKKITRKLTSLNYLEITKSWLPNMARISSGKILPSMCGKMK